MNEYALRECGCKTIDTIKRTWVRGGLCQIYRRGITLVTISNRISRFLAWWHIYTIQSLPFRRIGARGGGRNVVLVKLR